MKQTMIAVVGAGNADAAALRVAEEVGGLIARRDAILVCGGLGGVMEAAAKGARSEGGITVGILPQASKEQANPFITVPIATGFGEGRNVFIIRSADAVIAIGGEYGTLSEIAFALKTGRPVVGVGTWEIKGIHGAGSAEEAVAKAFGLVPGA
ncbi:MAG TPA: TIGR00725 family protein [Dissulfurispiraceae bacterium]